jgi:hypothetical protein
MGECVQAITGRAPRATGMPRGRIWRRAAALALLGALALALPTCGPAAGGADASALAVRGNRLVDGAGRPVRLLGVDRSGSEFACLQGGAPGDPPASVFVGPTGAGSVRAMVAWKIDAVRLPLNEDCWLGINEAPGRVNPAAAGPIYRDAVVGYVRALRAAGLYVILDLHWSSPGDFTSRSQQPMPDADHAPAFWRSVAGAFAGDRGVVFDVFNEPTLTDEYLQDPAQDRWACWRDGCTLAVRRTGVQPDTAPFTWQAVGMQALVDAVRSTGARNVIMLGGLNFAGDLSGWLAHVPHDPLGQLVASWHVYPTQQCAVESCWQGSIAPLALHVPVVIGETGDDNCSAPTLLPTLLPWADERGLSYLGWTWNPWNDCTNVLIRDDAGAPAPNYGQYFHDHVAQAVAARGYATTARAATYGARGPFWAAALLAALALLVLAVAAALVARRAPSRVAGGVDLWLDRTPLAGRGRGGAGGDE